MARTSALESFLDQESFRKGFCDGRDNISGFEVDLFDKSLLALTAQAESETYHWNDTKILATSSSDDPQTFSINLTRSDQEIVDSIREVIEAIDKHDEYQEKLDAYDRAMSIL